MITEQFINSCYTLVLAKTNIKKDISLYRDILEVLNFYKKKESIDIPINVKNKYDCLKKICELKLNGKENNGILDSILSGGKFNSKELSNFLKNKTIEEPNEKETSNHIEQIRLRKKLNILFKNYDDMSNLVDIIKNGNFETSDDLVSNYESTIKTMYTNLSECNRCIEIEASSSLDLKNDDFSSVLSTIKNKYSGITKTPTGYQVFDDEILGGGFEPSRVYVLAGGSGSGKSTLLNNIIVNSGTRNTVRYQNLDLNSSKDYIDIEKQKIYVYVTLENTIDESLLRTYQPLFNKTTIQTVNDIINGVDIKKSLVSEFEKNNSNVIMKYYSPKSISSIDLRMILDSILDKYPNSIIAGLFIDYLELLKPNIQYEHYRLELGQVVLDGKSIAVDYKIPVIIPTQLGRSAYRIDDPNQLNVDMMGESIKKVESADLVAMQVRDPIKEDIVHMKIGKNRCGKANVCIDFKVNWQCYKFINAFLASNTKSYDVSKENKFDFSLGNRQEI